MIADVDEARRRDLLDSTTTALLVTDPFGVVEDANAAAVTLFGIERHFLLGKPLAAFVAPPERPAFRKSVATMRARGTAAVSVKLATRRGRAVEVLVQVHVSAARPDRLQWALYEVGPDFETLVADLVDERTSALRDHAGEAERARAELEVALRGAPVGVAVVDCRSWEVLLASERLLELVDAPSSLAPGGRGLHLPFLRRGERIRQQLALRQGVLGESVQLPRPGGDTATVDVTAMRVRSAGPDVDVAFVLVLDRAARRGEAAEREFVANAAHRLHNPLTALATTVEVLQAGAKDDPDERDRFLRHLEQETRRLTRLSRALLLLARLQAEDAPPHTRVVPLQALLERLVAAAPIAQGVEVGVDCPDDVVVLAPPDLLEEALVNVVENAAKYTTRGSIRVMCTDAGEGRVRITVTDTGRGIAPEDRERVFDRFVRAAGDESGGVGLGLAISRDIVEDEDAIRESVAYRLRLEGWDVDEVADAGRALAWARARDYDAIVLDLILPDGSGLDVCRRLRAESDVPILILTARDDESDRVVGLELGADDYITKPFSLVELVSRVRAVLRRRDLDRDSFRVVKRVGGLAIDVERHQVTVDGEPRQLTPSEFRILALLAGAPGRVFTRRELTSALWGTDAFGDNRACDVHIAHLRRKLEPVPDAPRRILTVRGVGYRLDVV